MVLFWNSHIEHEKVIARIGRNHVDLKISHNLVLFFNLDFSIVEPENSYEKLISEKVLYKNIINFELCVNNKKFNYFDIIIISNKIPFRKNLTGLEYLMEKIFGHVKRKITVFCLFEEVIDSLIEKYFPEKLNYFFLITEKEDIYGNKFMQNVLKKYKCKCFFLLPKEWENFLTKFGVSFTIKDDIWKVNFITDNIIDYVRTLLISIFRKTVRKNKHLFQGGILQLYLHSLSEIFEPQSCSSYNDEIYMIDGGTEVFVFHSCPDVYRYLEKFSLITEMVLSKKYLNNEQDVNNFINQDDMFFETIKKISDTNSEIFSGILGGSNFVLKPAIEMFGNEVCLIYC